MGELDRETVTSAYETIERNAKAQAQLIDDLLDVSRIIAGKLRLDVRWIELKPVIEAAIETVQTAADAKGITLQSRLDETVGPISGDPDRCSRSSGIYCRTPSSSPRPEAGWRSGSIGSTPPFRFKYKIRESVSIPNLSLCF